MEGEREAAKQLEILRSLLVCMPTTTGLASWGGQRGAQLTNGIADQKKPIGNAVRLLFFSVVFFALSAAQNPFSDGDKAKTETTTTTTTIGNNKPDH